MTPTRQAVKKARPQVYTGWAVFSDGKPLLMQDFFYTGARQYQIYKTRTEAREIAEDVRRVEILVPR